MFDLRHGRAQGRDLLQLLLLMARRGDAVETDPQSDHVVLRFVESENTTGVEGVPEKRLRERFFQHGAHALESLELKAGKSVVLRLVAGDQVGENGLHPDVPVVPQTNGQLMDVFLFKPQTVHAGIQFHMDPKRIAVVFAQHVDQLTQQAEAVNLRLQAVAQHRFEILHFRIHDHDRQTDSGFPQLYPFIGVRYR